MNILISGGAGFVGSRLALLFKSQARNSRVVALDNLRRRGSEINLPAFKATGIDFVHGDIRQPTDLSDLAGNFDLFIEASAEPSVLTGMQGTTPHYAIQTNLGGTVNCLEFARARCGAFLFLSTSRVYSIPALRELKLHEDATRFRATPVGIDESFPTSSYRSIYGATKLASELLIQEYAHAYGLKALINRCGVICGPGQFGKVDQGVFTLWIARHHFGKGLSYTGFGGKGKQVRDLLHPEDLFKLLQQQLAEPAAWDASVYNIGGGEKVSTSLLEWTAAAEKATGHRIKIESNPDSASVDVPYYVTDYSRAAKRFGWSPERGTEQIAAEIAAWIRENESQLKSIFS